jgi:hypothetical protein
VTRRAREPDADLFAADLAARIPVWEILSELWLDTELQDSDFDRIAGVIAKSPYSPEQLKNIHCCEVVPAVSANVLSVAGEWAGFDSEWLAAKCCSNARRRGISRRIRYWLDTPVIWFFTARLWHQIMMRVTALRTAAAWQTE